MQPNLFMAMYANSPLSSPLWFLLRTRHDVASSSPLRLLRTSRMMAKGKGNTASPTPPHPTAPPPPSSQPTSSPSLFPPTPRPRWPLRPPPLPPVDLTFCQRLCSHRRSASSSAMLVFCRSRVGPVSLRVSAETVFHSVFCWFFHSGQCLSR